LEQVDVDITQIILAAITAITTIALAYIAGRWQISRKNNKSNKDSRDNKQD
jgi:cytochrome oxidase assembly protein ShyY1